AEERAGRNGDPGPGRLGAGMKTSLLLSIGVVLLAAPLSFAGESAPAESVAAAVSARLGPREALLFRNGDLLYGALESITPDRGVRWHHSDVDQTIEFKPDNVAEIHFPSVPGRATNSMNACRVQLGNSDELDGSLVLLDSEKAVLQTWYAGEIV